MNKDQEGLYLSSDPVIVTCLGQPKERDTQCSVQARTPELISFFLFGDFSTCFILSVVKRKFTIPYKCIKCLSLFPREA